MTDGRSRPSRHPARRARMAVAGLSVAAMLGLTAALGIADRPAKDERLSSVAAAQSGVVSGVATPRPTSRPVKEPPPIKMTARRVVRTVVTAAPAGAARPVAQAAAAPSASTPTAVTSGSQ